MVINDKKKVDSAALDSFPREMGKVTARSGKKFFWGLGWRKMAF